MNDKKYYWLKLEENYFDLKVQKALRKLPSGSDMLICYLKMQLKYLNTGGIIEFQGIYDDLAQELALDIDEEEDLVKMTLSILEKWKVLEPYDNGIYITEMQERIGSKTDVALRVARHRERQKMLHCNTNETKCNSIKEIEIEKEIDKEKDKYMCEFDELWKLYPKKIGKKDALRHYIRNRKNKVPYETILDGLKKYIEYINNTNTPTQFIKDGSTWFNQECWNDEREVEHKETEEEWLARMEKEVAANDN